MTSIIATITPERAWVSQDRAVYDPATGRRTGTIEHKVHRLDSHHMLIASAGPLFWCRALPHAIEALPGVSADYRPDDDIERLHGMIGELMRGIAQSYPSPSRAIVVAAGYTTDGCLAYSYDSENSFAPCRFTGHCFTPDPEPSLPGYQRLRSMERAAADGSRVPEFHRLIAENQYAAATRGLYPDCLSRTISTAMLDKDGCHGGRAPEGGDMAELVS